MSNDKPPPILRYRDIKRFYGVQVEYRQLAKWEECDLIHPFRPEPHSRALYYRSELEKIFNLEQTV